MPDPTLKTVSASQVPALYGRSPYLTEFMLYHHFKKGMPIGFEGERLTWGKRLESVILHAVADDLRLDVMAHPQERYDRASETLVGCTRDADTVDPSLGYGVVEAKNVDGLIFKKDWDDDHAPPHIELQVQTQMMVPHPTLGMPKWGVIAALVGGNDLRILRRLPDAKMQADIAKSASAFLKRVDKGDAPDPLGVEREVPGLKWLYPERAPGKDIAVSDPEFIAQVEEYEALRAQRLDIEKLEKSLRVKILAKAEDAETVSAGPFLIALKKQERAGYVVKPTSLTTFTIKRTDSV